MRTVPKTASYCCSEKGCSQMTASYNLRASFARSYARGRRFCLAGIGGSIRQLAKSMSFSSHCCHSVGYSGSLEAEPLQALFNHYKVVQDPALYNRRYSDALKDFVEESILAYECGYSHTIVEARVDAAREAQGQDPQGVRVDWHHLQRSLSLVWLTLMISPRSVPRFHTAPVVDENTARQLKGFVTLIVTAYYEKRWAWYPLGQLQLELAATGPTEKPHNVAEMARLVYATLEAVAPQFPK